MNWDNYFIKIAEDVSMKSKDKSTKVGCVIVDQDNRIVSTGYNGWVAGCNESMMTHERPLKYNLVVHAEANALLFARRDLRGCRMYCSHAPCDNCLKHILQSGIRWIMFDKTDHVERYDENMLEAIHRLLEATNATCTNTSGLKFSTIISLNFNKDKKA